MSLAQALDADRSCQKAVNDYAAARVAAGLRPCSVDTSSYCAARQRLPREMITALVRHTGQLLHRRAPGHWCWQRRRVATVDGTTVTMPDTPENQIVYPQHGNQKPGLGAPIARMTGLMCTATGAVLDVALGPCKGKNSDEQAHLRMLLGELEPGDVLLGDALFPSYFLLAELVRLGVEGVFDQLAARRAGIDFRKGRRLGPRDHVIELRRPAQRPHWMERERFEALPEKLELRETRVREGKRPTTLVSTMTDAKAVPASALKNLYKKRWGVELDLRDIKSTLGMDVLSCKTPSMVAKEIWIHLLAYNLIRLLMAQAALTADREPRSISFKHTVQLWSAWCRHGAGLDDEGVRTMLTLVAHNIVGNRPGRIEPRAVKKRPKPFARLWAPRAEARAHVRRHGHA